MDEITYSPLPKRFLQGTREQWQLCFLMSALMYLVGWLSYMIFGKSDVQEWAKIDNENSDITLEVTSNIIPSQCSMCMYL